VTQVEAIVERLVRDFQSFLVVLSGPGALIVVPDDREHPTVPLDLSIEGENSLHSPRSLKRRSATGSARSASPTVGADRAAGAGVLCDGDEDRARHLQPARGAARGWKAVGAPTSREMLCSVLPSETTLEPRPRKFEEMPGRSEPQKA
jgi:hypothetical protein